MILHKRNGSIYVAGSFSSGGVDAEDVVRDDAAVSGSAVSSADTWGGHLHENWRDALQWTIGGLSPSADQKGVANVIGFTGWCQT